MRRRAKEAPENLALSVLQWRAIWCVPVDLQIGEVPQNLFFIVVAQTRYLVVRSHALVVILAHTILSTSHLICPVSFGYTTVQLI
jgi:hypothetical protein